MHVYITSSIENYYHYAHIVTYIYDVDMNCEIKTEPEI